ncbi:uncharacterized protein [Porites lutea]|uniref:uncharacterized protein n=1 Tax=Porites lutea TaxID=51062 RepID=UPI003CC52CD2
MSLEKTNRNVRICELSNTEKYLEPQKIHERPGYDYYGNRISETRTRGPGLGEFSCQYKAQVTVLPFIDNRCNVVELYIKVIKNDQCRNAKRFCDLLGATVASYDKLYSAWKAALQKCA